MKHNTKPTFFAILLTLTATLILSSCYRTTDNTDKDTNSSKTEEKQQSLDIAKAIEGKWEIVDQNIGNAQLFSTLYNIKDAEIMDFSRDIRSRKNDNEYRGTVKIGDNSLSDWSLNSDGSKIVISDDIFEICFSDDEKQMTLTKPKEKITITLKRW